MTRRAETRKAIVAGGSAGGLFIGNMLGWQVDIFERSFGGLNDRDADIAGHDELTILLVSSGLTDQRPPRIGVEGRTAHRRGRIAQYDFAHYLTSWNAIFKVLCQVFPGEHDQLGIELNGAFQQGGCAVAILSNGSTRSAGFIIGADGVRSTVRSVVAPDFSPRYSGHVAWPGMTDEFHLSADFMAAVLEKRKLSNLYCNVIKASVCSRIAKLLPSRVILVRSSSGACPVRKLTEFYVRSHHPRTARLPRKARKRVSEGGRLAMKRAVSPGLRMPYCA